MNKTQKKRCRLLNRKLTTFKTCECCHVSLDLTNYFNDYKTYWSVCKKCHLSNKKLSLDSYLEKNPVFKKCYYLIKDFQKKRYSLDKSDIFRLIDVWDDIYPGDAIQGNPDFNRIMGKVYKWFVKEWERVLKTEL